MARHEGGRGLWAYLKRRPHERTAWREHAARPVFEAGAASPVRVRGEADRVALPAWQDPDAGAVSPFREEAPALDVELRPGARPLVAPHDSRSQEYRPNRNRQEIWPNGQIS